MTLMVPKLSRTFAPKLPRSPIPRKSADTGASRIFQSFSTPPRTHSISKKQTRSYTTLEGGQKTRISHLTNPPSRVTQGLAGIFLTAALYISLASSQKNNSSKERSDSSSPRSSSSQEQITQKLNEIVAKAGNKDIVVVAGGTADLGSGVIKEALKRGYYVIATTRRPDHGGLKESDSLTWVTLPQNVDEQPTFWENLFTGLKLLEKDKSFAINRPRNIIAVNSMGGAHPKEGETVYDMNYTTATALFSTFAKAQLNMKKNAIQFSSLSEKIVPITTGDAEEDVDPDNEYGRIKRLTTRYLETIPTDKLPNLTIFRIGYILPALKRSEGGMDLSGQHGYDFNQISKMPLQPILTSEKHPDGEFPMQVLCHEDFLEGVGNSFTKEGRNTIDAVGETVVTPPGVIKFYAKLNGTDYRPFYLPSTESTTRLARLTSEGHWAPYAVVYCREGGVIVDATAFKTLLQHSPRGLEAHILSGKEIETLTSSESPLLKHVGKVAKKMITDPAYGRDVALAVKDVAVDKIQGKK
jgi:hypothetical protein